MRTLLVCAWPLLCTAPALAQQRVDPFLSDTEGGGSFEEEVESVRDKALGAVEFNGAQAELPRLQKQLEERNRFSSSMESLLRSAGVDPHANDSTNDSNWGNFEEADETAEENYQSSFEWQMKTENAKQLNKPEPFKNGLDYVEEKLKEFDSPEQDIEREMRKYQRPAKDDE